MESVEVARCALHPDRAANAGTCVRCGSFMCDSCRVASATALLCGTCHERIYGDARMLRHLSVFTIALAVHAGFVTLFGLFAAIFGGSLAASFGSAPAPPGTDAETLALTESTLVVMFLGLGAAHLGVGALQGFAAFRMWRHRSRGLAIAALVSGLLLAFGCYCAPSAIGVLVWGLVVMLNPVVVERFAAASRSDS